MRLLVAALLLAGCSDEDRMLGADAPVATQPERIPLPAPTEIADGLVQADAATSGVYWRTATGVFRHAHGVTDELLAMPVAHVLATADGYALGEAANGGIAVTLAGVTRQLPGVMAVVGSAEGTVWYVTQRSLFGMDMATGEQRGYLHGMEFYDVAPTEVRMHQVADALYVRWGDRTSFVDLADATADRVVPITYADRGQVVFAGGRLVAAVRRTGSIEDGVMQGYDPSRALVTVASSVTDAAVIDETAYFLVGTRIYRVGADDAFAILEGGTAYERLYTDGQQLFATTQAGALFAQPLP